MQAIRDKKRWRFSWTMAHYPWIWWVRQTLFWLALILLIGLSAVIVGMLGAERASAVSITIYNNNGTGPPCVLRMGNSEVDFLHTLPGSSDVLVGGTFDSGDPCYRPLSPPPTGRVSVPPWVVPTGAVPFGVDWEAHHASSCTFVGSGWSGHACGDGAPACQQNAFGEKIVTLPSGVYEFGLSCKNPFYPARIVHSIYLLLD